MTQKLEEFRRKIDAIDDKLINLLMERTELVAEVGALKDKTAPGICPIRPGRETSMVRRIAGQFADTAFPPSAAAAIWRIIIGASTSVEAELKVAVYATDKENDMFWLAREYFGPSAQIIREPHFNRVIGNIMDGKASVGVLPMWRRSDTTGWWTNLLQPGKDTPKIFAHVPFIAQGREAQSALAIGQVIPEDSGDDISVWVLEAEHNTSQSRLQAAFAGAKMEAAWIHIGTSNPASRQHVITVKGFVTPEHTGMRALLAGLGPSIMNSAYLGSYGTPLVLAKEKQHEQATA